MYIHWDPTFETGQLLIDAQHRLLVMLFRKLDVAIKLNQPGATLARIVLEVQKFVEFHFVSEENLMLETGYPEIDSHRVLHRKLLTELKAMMAKLASHREYPDDLLDFMVRWLVDHIADQDQKVARHVRSAVDRPVAELIYAEYLLATPPRVAQERSGDA